MLAEDFEDTPPGGKGGLWLPSIAPAPTTEEPAGLQIEPPEWQDQLERGDLDLAALAPPEAEPDKPLDAVAAMKEAAGDSEEPRDWSPPVVTEPIQPLAIPRPDWEAEQRERVQQPEPPPAPPPAPPIFIPPAPWSKSAP